jgi:hypothetical protein
LRHARDQDLDRIEALLERLRDLGELRERKRGCFYFKSKGFVHFHEDPKGMFADLRQVASRDDRRLKVDTPAEQDALITQARKVLAALSLSSSSPAGAQRTAKQRRVAANAGDP